MKGSILTKEKCPKCGGKFQGEPLVCPSCLTEPRRYFLRLYWKKPLKIYSGRDSHPLDSWERAHRLLSTIRLEMDEDRFDPKNYQSKHIKGLLCPAYFQEWLKRQQIRHYKLQEISLGYVKNLESMLNNHLLPFFADMSIKDLTEGTIKKFKDELLAKLHPKTAENILMVLHAILADAFERGDISRVPPFPKVNKPDPVIKWIEEEDQLRVLAQVKHPVYRAYFLFLMKMGCRPGEARALRWEDVDLKRGLVVIRAAMDINTYRPTTKEGDVRHLALHPEVWEVLKKLPVQLRKDGYVFALGNQPLKKNDVTMVWSRAAKKAGVYISLYQGTKHSMGCQLANRGVPLDILAAWFGHRDVKTTKRYAKINLTGRKNIWLDSVSPEGPQAKNRTKKKL